MVLNPEAFTRCLASRKSRADDGKVNRVPAPHLAGEVLRGVCWEAGPRGLYTGGWVQAPHGAVGRGSVTELDTLRMAEVGHSWVEGFIGCGWDSWTEVPAPQGVWERVEGH